MSYRIDYAPQKTRKKNTRHPGRSVIAFVLLLFVIISAVQVSGLQEHLVPLLLPGDPQVTQEAFVQLVERLHRGEGFQQAVVVFCQQILDGAAA